MIGILKFGGTALGNAQHIRHAASLVEQAYFQPQEPLPVVVVSAMSGVTDQLLQIARFACTGEDEELERELSALKQRHLAAAQSLVSDPQAQQDVCQELRRTFVTLEQDIDALKERQQHEHMLTHTAAVAAWGERLCVLLMAAALQETGVQAEPVREDVILTTSPHLDEASSAGSVIGSEPLLAETRRKVRDLLFPLFRRRLVPIVAGFIGRTLDGSVTTLGRNGSDYSAALIAAALDAVEVTIYTDVDGVLTADPRLVANTRLLPVLSYAEAARLSWFGAKVLHPRTLIPVAPRRIPVRVRNTFRPHIRGTVVGSEEQQRSAVAAITVRRHLALITMESTDLFGAPENAGQVFELAARAGAAPVAICSSSGHHLSFAVEEQAAESVVALLQHDLGTWRVRARPGLAACACIGSGFTADPMSPSRAISALARERIPIITQGASELGIILMIEDQESERALCRLHRDLIVSASPLLFSEQERLDKRQEEVQV